MKQHNNHHTRLRSWRYVMDLMLNRLNYSWNPLPSVIRVVPERMCIGMMRLGKILLINLLPLKRTSIPWSRINDKYRLLSLILSGNKVNSIRMKRLQVTRRIIFPSHQWKRLKLTLIKCTSSIWTVSMRKVILTTSQCQFHFQ